MKLFYFAQIFAFLSYSGFVHSTSLSTGNSAQQGLDKLKFTLSNLQGKAPITLALSSTFSENHEGAIKQGGITAFISENELGFQLTYPKTELEKIAQEQKASVEQFGQATQEGNDEISTSTSSAANKLKAIELSQNINMATELSLLMQRAKFLPSQSSYSSTQAQNILTFELPVDLLLRNKRTRKYVDEFSATYQLFIDANGVPLNSELAYKGSGSAYFVLHIKAFGNQSETYQVINNRLILSDSNYTQGTESIFGDFERKEEQSLRLHNNVID